MSHSRFESFHPERVTLREIFRIADDEGVTSLEAANRVVEYRLAVADQSAHSPA